VVATAEADPRRIRFKRHHRVAEVPGEAVYLVSEHEVLTLEGDLIHRVAPLLDGRYTTAEVADRLAGEVPAARVFYLLERLIALGHLRLVDAAEEPRSAAYWDLAGAGVPLPSGAAGAASNGIEAASGTVGVVSLGEVPGGEFATLLRREGIRVADDAPSPDGSLSVVICDHYLHPELPRLNAEYLATGRPWLLAKPVGPTVWVGPLFRPRRNACWGCLAQRFQGNRSAEAYLENRLSAPTPLAPPADLPVTREIGLRLIALEVMKWLAGLSDDRQDDLFAFDTLTLSGVRHSLRARPQCPACGDPNLVASTINRPVISASRVKTFTTDGGHRARSPEEVLDRYENLVSPVTGVVSDLTRIDSQISAIKGYTAGHNPAQGVLDLRTLRAGLRSHNCGKGITDTQARASALGEAVERYSGVFQGDEPRMRASLMELGDDAVHPNECQLYSDEQYRDRYRVNSLGPTFFYVSDPFDEDARLDWTPVWSVTERRHKYLPTSYLYYGYPFDDEPIYAWADSNGNAAGSSLEDAIVQGFLELVERDGVALWWYNRLRRPAVDLDSFREPWFDRIRSVHVQLRRAMWVLDLTSDFGIPTVVAVSRRTDKPAEDILMGFGAHFDPKIAVQRALTELNQFLPAVINVDTAGYANDDEFQLAWWRTATVATQPYLVPDAAQPARNRSSYDNLSSPDLLDDLHTAQSLVEARGMEFLVLDQTRPDLELPVVKVIVPGMRHFWTRFAPGRLYDIPVRLGWLDAPPREADLNPIGMFLLCAGPPWSRPLGGSSRRREQPMGPHLTHRYSFRRDVRLQSEHNDLVISHRWGALTVPDVSPALRTLFEALAFQPVPIDRFADILTANGRQDADVTADLARLHATLDRLPFTLVHSLDVGDRRLLSIIPMATTAIFAARPPTKDQMLRLSRFAFLRRRESTLVVESPLSPYRIELLGAEACQVVTGHIRPTAIADLAGGAGDEDLEVLRAVAGHLIGAGVLVAAEGAADPADVRFAEDEDEAIQQWAFHDLLFHSRSRLGRHDEDFGATFAFLGKIEPEPAVKRESDHPALPLYRPELNDILDRDPPFTAVLESRRSVRRYADEPIGVRQLGELLYRVARVRGVFGPLHRDILPYESSDRPYPSAGSVYELELYITVHRCDGLAQAIYHYDPAGHRLVRISTDIEHRKALLESAYISAGGGAMPDVLITITARIQRLTWKYDGLAYATALKHVGVLYQTLYLVATAMELAPCGLDAGDTELATQAFGLDWSRESSVGEFILGNRPPQWRPGWSPSMNQATWRPINDPDWATESISAERLEVIRGKPAGRYDAE
jgi:ribosomal protein S12 methylthiotransferase accessory factor